jgi:hypothetical protein
VEKGKLKICYYIIFAIPTFFEVSLKIMNPFTSAVLNLGYANSE